MPAPTETEGQIPSSGVGQDKRRNLAARIRWRFRPRSWRVRRGRLYRLLQEVFLATLLLTSLTTIADHLHYLDWLKVVTVRMIAFDRPVLDSRESPTPKPVVLAIDDALYETSFKATSPLDRGKLKTLIEAIADAKPGIVAIDLDLSPGVDEVSSDIDPRPLDLALCSAAFGTGSETCESAWRNPQENPFQNGCGLRIVLIDPITGDGGTLGSRAAIWRDRMIKRFRQCIHFAEPDLLAHGRWILYFEADRPSLGTTAFALARDPNRPARTKSRGERPLIRTDLIRAALVPASAGTPAQAVKHVLVELNGFTTQSGMPLADVVQGRAVFLGGTWGRDDKHDTAFADDVDGVLVHAAIYDTLGRKLQEYHLLHFLMDIGFGVLFGMVFARAWHRYAGAGIALTHWHDPTAQSVRLLRSLAPTGCYERYGLLVERMWRGAVAWLIVLIAIGLAIAGSAKLFGNGIYVDAAPIIVGLVVHTLIESRGLPAEHARHFRTEALHQPIKCAAAGRAGCAAKPTVRAEFGRAIWVVRSVLAFGIVAAALLIAVEHDFHFWALVKEALS